MRDLIEMIVFVIVFYAGIVAIVIGVVWPLGYTTCENQYSAYSPQYGFWSGCRIEWQGKLTPTDNIILNQQSMSP